MSYQHWNFSIENKIARLQLNRPEKQNRMDDQTLLELQSITKSIAEDRNIWAVIIEGTGARFSSGMDVNLIGGMIGQDYETYKANLYKFQSILDEFEKLEKPTIAKIHGYCLGGGLILALCCDFRIAADNTIFGLPEVKRSIGVIMGTQRITRVAGIAATKEMVMLGENFDAQKGLAYGLVNEVVPFEILENTVKQLANKFHHLPPLAVGLCKKIINEGQFLARAGQDLEIEAQAKLLDSQDFQEAIKSFFEKREPKYQGL